jgi:uncharacterized RDD family membrane protein YckC
MQPKYFGRRILATSIDYGVCFLLFYLYARYAGEPTETGYSVHGFAALIPVLYWFIYFIVSEALLSATPGHIAVGLKVLRLDGKQPGIVDSLKRRLMDPIDFFFFGIPAIITIRNTPYAQRLGDIWAHTKVLRTEEEEA